MSCSGTLATYVVKEDEGGEKAWVWTDGMVGWTSEKQDDRSPGYAPHLNPNLNPDLNP